MSALTSKTDDGDHSHELERLVESVGDLPEIPDRLRTRILMAATRHRPPSSPRTRWLVGGLIAAACCIVAVLIVAGRQDQHRLADDRPRSAANSEDAESTIPRPMRNRRKILESDVLSP